MTNDPKNTALVIGVAGAFGSAAAKALHAHGWTLRALSRRDPDPSSSLPPGVDWRRGDALDPEAVAAAASGCSLIVHAANPPGYQGWDRLVLPMMQSTIHAAKIARARIVLPGNVYNFGPDAGSVVSEDAPQAPVTRKGKIRVALERCLKDSGAKTLIIRGGDFFGPGVTASSWFATMVKPGRPVSKVTYPGDPGVGHAWAYLPDMAEAMARLADRQDELDTFAAFNFGGHWLEDGLDMARAIISVAEASRAVAAPFPWWALTLAAPVSPFCREVLEMRYLWRRPLRLDNAKLRGFLGAEPHVSLNAAVAFTLESLGSLRPGWPLDGRMDAAAAVRR